MAKTVLIVDDNAFVRRALCALFKSQEDFEVCGEAGNGREAITKARRLHPDLIVLDLLMPVMNGLDAARVSSVVPCRQFRLSCTALSRIDFQSSWQG